MIIHAVTDENDNRTIFITVGTQTESIPIGEWSRLIANPIEITPSPGPKLLELSAA